MSTGINPEPAISISTDRKSNDLDSESPGTPPMKTEDVEKNGTPPVVDPETEAKILRKLDIRIIPMVCWIYLMNFMDRGKDSMPF
jgi:hypothetical protein